MEYEVGKEFEAIHEILAMHEQRLNKLDGKGKKEEPKKDKKKTM